MRKLLLIATVLQTVLSLSALKDIVTESQDKLEKLLPNPKEVDEGGDAGHFEHYQDLPLYNAQVRGITTFDIEGNLYMGLITAEAYGNYGIDKYKVCIQQNGSFTHYQDMVFQTIIYDAEYLTMEGEHYLVLVLIWTHNSLVYRWNGTGFVLHSQLQRGLNSFDIEHLEVEEVAGTRAHFLSQAVLDGPSVIYKWSGDGFSPYQSLPFTGAKSSGSFETDKGDAYVVYAMVGRQASLIYRFDAGAGTFVLHQELPLTSSCYALSMFCPSHGSWFLYENTYEEASSPLYRFTKGRLELYQMVDSPYRNTVCANQIGSAMYFLVANYNDGGSEFATSSTLYKDSGSEFTEHQTLVTYGAYACHMFTSSGTVYMMVANHHNYSVIYKWSESNDMSQNL